MVAFHDALKGAALVAALLAGQAQAITIDFEDGDRAFVRQTQDENACINDFTVQHNGFTFANQRDCGAYYEYSDGLISDNMALFFATSGNFTPGGRGPSLLEMTSDSGSVFDVYSLDLILGAAYYVDVFGYLDDNLLYQERLFVDGFIDTKQIDFLGVDKISFSQERAKFNSIGLDNLEVSVVPVPAAVWLFGSALAGLGWRGRYSR